MTCVNVKNAQMGKYIIISKKDRKQINYHNKKLINEFIRFI